MELEAWAPYVRRCCESVLEGPMNLQERVLYDYELIWLEKGNWTWIQDDIPYSCQEGDMLLVRPNHRLILQIDSGTTISQPHVHFDPVYSPDRKQVPVSFKSFDTMTPEEKHWILPDDLLPPEIPLVFRPARSSRLPALLRQLITCTERHAPLYQLESRQIMLQILQSLLQEFSVNPKKAYAKDHRRLMTEVKDFIDHNYMNAITLDSLAGLFFIDKYYLTRLFKQHYGISVIDYSRKVRISQAQELLKQGYGVTEISNLLGYENVCNFSRAFLKATGMRPSAYIDQIPK